MNPEYTTLTSILVSRHSCRHFLSTPVTRDIIERIVTAAGRSPSWCNAQPWQIIVTAGAETERFRMELLAAVESSEPKFDITEPVRYAGVYGDRRRTCGYQLYESVGIARDDTSGRKRQAMENFRLFGAPHVAIVTSEADLGPYGVMDTGGYVTAFTLAAASLGIATIAQASIAQFSPFVRSFFGIPPNRLIICAISLGYEDETHPANAFRTERAEVREIMEWRE